MSRTLHIPVILLLLVGGTWVVDSQGFPTNPRPDIPCTWGPVVLSTQVESSTTGSLSNVNLKLLCPSPEFKMLTPESSVKGIVQIDPNGDISYYASAIVEQVQTKVQVGCPGRGGDLCLLTVTFEAKGLPQEPSAAGEGGGGEEGDDGDEGGDSTDEGGRAAHGGDGEDGGAPETLQPSPPPPPPPAPLPTPTPQQGESSCPANPGAYTWHQMVHGVDSPTMRMGCDWWMSPCSPAVPPGHGPDPVFFYSNCTEFLTTYLDTMTIPWHRVVGGDSDPTADPTATVYHANFSSSPKSDRPLIVRVEVTCDASVPRGTVSSNGDMVGDDIWGIVPVKMNCLGDASDRSEGPSPPPPAPLPTPTPATTTDSFCPANPGGYTWHQMLHGLGLGCDWWMSPCSPAVPPGHGPDPVFFYSNCTEFLTTYLDEMTIPWHRVANNNQATVYHANFSSSPKSDRPLIVRVEVTCDASVPSGTVSANGDMEGGDMVGDDSWGIIPIKMNCLPSGQSEEPSPQPPSPVPSPAPSTAPWGCWNHVLSPGSAYDHAPTSKEEPLPNCGSISTSMYTSYFNTSAHHVPDCTAVKIQCPAEFTPNSTGQPRKTKYIALYTVLGSTVTPIEVRAGNTAAGGAEPNLLKTLETSAQMETHIFEGSSILIVLPTASSKHDGKGKTHSLENVWIIEWACAATKCAAVSPTPPTLPSGSGGGAMPPSDVLVPVSQPVKIMSDHDGYGFATYAQDESCTWAMACPRDYTLLRVTSMSQLPTQSLDTLELQGLGTSAGGSSTLSLANAHIERTYEIGANSQIALSFITHHHSLSLPAGSSRGFTFTAQCDKSATTEPSVPTSTPVPEIPTTILPSVPHTDEPSPPQVSTGSQDNGKHHHHHAGSDDVASTPKPHSSRRLSWSPETVRRVEYGVVAGLILVVGILVGVLGYRQCAKRKRSRYDRVGGGTREERGTVDFGEDPTADDFDGDGDYEVETRELTAATTRSSDKKSRASILSPAAESEKPPTVVSTPAGQRDDASEGTRSAAGTDADEKFWWSGKEGKK